MEIFNAAILGIVQGITEFLPVSSSGHLILVRGFLDQQVAYGLAFDAVLQLATTLAIIVYFRKDIWRLIVSFFKLIFGRENDSKQKRMTLAIIVGTIPAVFLGILFEKAMESTFRSSVLVIVTLILGAVVMAWAEKLAKQNNELTVKKGLWIGLFQSLALIPGMSRSGMTISGGLFNGLNRVEATRFSFLLAFPILLGSGIKKLLDLSSDGLLSVLGGELLIGSIVAFAVGLLAIHFLITYLKSHTLKVFVWYRVGLAVVLTVILFVV